MVSVRLNRLVELSHALLEASQLDERLQLVTDAALAVTGADHASIRLCDANALRAAARSGCGAREPAPRFALGEGVMGWVASEGVPVRIDDARLDPRFRRRRRGFAIDSLVSVPIRSGGASRGVLSVSSARRAAFDSEDETVVSLLANAAAQVLHASELEQLAMTDSQTLAYNRRCLIPRLREEMARALRHHEPLSVVLLDLDHFKSVNDKHGHAVGDEVLRAFADLVRECVRADDVLVRRGGEEFVLIMPATDGEQGTAVAERIRGRLEARPLSVRSVLVRQTVSVGIATWDGCERAEDLDERADLAMYEAKRQGRNRVMASDRPAAALRSG